MSEPAEKSSETGEAAQSTDKVKSIEEVDQLMSLNKGAIIELDRKVGEAIDVYVNNNLVARGEVVVVDDKLGITMTEVVKAAK